MVLIGPGCITDRKLGQPEFGIQTQDQADQAAEHLKGQNTMEPAVSLSLLEKPEKESARGSESAQRERESAERVRAADAGRDRI